MSKSTKKPELIMVDNHAHTRLMLTDLHKVNVKNISKQKNNKMLAYLHLLVEDILVFRDNFDSDIYFSMDDYGVGIELDISYPYYTDPIYLYFSFDRPASIETLAAVLSDVSSDDHNWCSKEDIEIYLDCSVSLDNELMLSDCKPLHIDYGRKLMNNVKLVDSAFFFENRLINTYYNHSTIYSNVHVESSPFNFMVLRTDSDEPYIVIRSPFVKVDIQSESIAVEFNELNKFIFSSSCNFERDLTTIQYFIKSFISKNKDEEIVDLKNEILLLEMELI